MNITTLGLILLLLLILYYLFLSVKLFLIGKGMLKHPIKGDYVIDKTFVVRGIIGFVVTIPSLCLILLVLFSR